METEKKTLVIIHGLDPKRERYDKIIKIFSEDYDVKYFPYDNRISLKIIVDELMQFVDKNKIKSAYFLTHSFGSIVFKLFYERRNCSVLGLVQLAPLNNGSTLLRRVYHLGFGKRKFGTGPKEFLKDEQYILSLPLPPDTGVIAGNKNSDPNSKNSSLIPWIMNNRDSDGKILISETKYKKIKDEHFFLVNEYHSYLMMNDLVIEKSRKFFLDGKF